MARAIQDASLCWPAERRLPRSRTGPGMRNADLVRGDKAYSHPRPPPPAALPRDHDRDSRPSDQAATAAGAALPKAAPVGDDRSNPAAATSSNEPLPPTSADQPSPPATT